MKILMAIHTLKFPTESGVTKRTFHLLEEMTRRHEVTALALGSPEDEARVRQQIGHQCREIVYVDGRVPRWVSLVTRIRLGLTGRSLLRQQVSARFQRALDELVRRERFDLVILSFPGLTYYRLPPGIPTITDTHNVEYDIWRRYASQSRGLVARAYHRYQAWLMKRDELAACRGGDALLTTSERDRDVFQADLPAQSIHVVPNGVDLDFFTPPPVEPRPNSLVFCGLMNWAPNDEGMTFFLDRVFPLVQQEVPDATLTIVGANASRALQRRATDRIVVTGYVTDVRPYVAAGQVYVIPLLVGGGTRLKALEAMAMRKPIVTTSVGCEGIDLVQGESALFADAPEGLAAAIVRLFREPALRAHLADRASALAHQQYGWRSIGDRLDAIAGEVVARRRTGGAAPPGGR
ncbi:MAG: glycosyltransferase [Anaeromyxobacter sp.]|nr:glycosyltransferase [Anaeromyxobacter sp.]